MPSPDTRSTAVFLPLAGKGTINGCLSANEILIVKVVGFFCLVAIESIGMRRGIAISKTRLHFLRKFMGSASFRKWFR